MLSVGRVEEIIQEILLDHVIECQINYLLSEYPEKLDADEEDNITHIFEILTIDNLSFEAKEFLQKDINKATKTECKYILTTPCSVDIIWGRE
jgi:hypothetical protein